MKTKTRAILKYIQERLGERSTWQGIAWVIGLFSTKAAGFNLDEALFVGTGLAALLKIILCD
jgi:hypothetical protein